MYDSLFFFTGYLLQEQALHTVHSIVILMDKDTCPRPEKQPGLQVRNKNNFLVPTPSFYISQIWHQRWVLFFFPSLPSLCLYPLDGHGDVHESPKQDSWSFPADLWPGWYLYLQPFRLDAVPSGTECSLNVSTELQQLFHHIPRSLW